MHRFIPDEAAPPFSANDSAIIKSWIRDALGCGDDVPITLANAACRDPGCPVVETTVTVWWPHRSPQVIPFARPQAALTRLMIVQAVRGSTPAVSKTRDPLFG
ncbi:MAG TPA: hypothetical protein PLN52_05240 [Opitutaceae bacterium]|nr:hypothetical protein [Opitutaceae bacterium]